MMAWNPAIPATNADLLSAPVRDNFGALDTALMAALATLANGSVLTKAAGPVIAGIPAVATGAVLTSAGVSTAPTWSTAPALTGLTLSGLTATQLVFAGAGGMLSGDADLTFTVATNQLKVGAGTSVSSIDPTGFGSNVPGGIAELFGTSGTNTPVVKLSATGGHSISLFAAGTGAALGANSVGLYDTTLARTLFYFDNTGNLFLSVTAAAPRLVWTGAPDSGGAGNRMLVIAN
jgi:hypothetical protein